MLTSAHKQKVVDSMPVYSIASQGNDAITLNNSVIVRNFKFHCTTLLKKHLTTNEVAATRATTST
jgi:hypothetical protein